MPNIETILKKTIKQSSAISVKDFLFLVLHHEKYGYYRKRNIVGKDGDFTTAPEISQVFGEIISNSILINTEQFKNYQNISFVELGPGRGVLAKDMLRTFKKLNIKFIPTGGISVDNINDFLSIDNVIAVGSSSIK